MFGIISFGFLIGLLLGPQGSLSDRSPTIQLITYPVDHAEVPSWDGRKNILYYADIHTGRVFSWNYDTEEINYIQLDGTVAPLVPSKNNPDLLLVGLNRSVVAVEWDGSHTINGAGKEKVLATVSEQFITSRFNDGKADKKGRLWWGTMGAENTSNGDLTPNNGVLYKITKENLDDPTVEIAPVNISNGVAWNRANDKFYYIDTPTLQIAEYDYNDKDGTISNRRVAVDIANFTSLTGKPDGMATDINDNLWITLYGGGAVIHVDPRTGELLQVIALPARDVTSVMWGGPKLDILFVTTSRISLTDEQKKYYPAAGGVFAIKHLHTRGLPVFNANIVNCI